MTVLLFLGPALLLLVLEGATWAAGIVTVVAAVLAVLLGQPRLDEVRSWRLPAAMVSVAVPVLLAPGGVLPVLLAGAGGFGVLAWIMTITEVPMGPGRRTAGLLLPLVGIAATVTVALVVPGLSVGPGFAALLVVLAVFVAALGLLGGPEPTPPEVTDLEGPEGPEAAPTP